MKKMNLFYAFLIILPIIDLITSLSNHLFDSFFSLGTIVKGLEILIGIYYIIFKSASKYRKVSIYFLLGIFFYCVGYFLFKPDLLNFYSLKCELTYLFKFLYFPILVFAFLNFFDDYGFDKEKLTKIMIINLAIYMFFIIVPTIFHLNFSSYNNIYTGSVGWYYSANEVSTILLLLFPFIYTLINKKFSLLVVLFGLALYMISLIGTKVTLFGMIIISFLAFLCTFKAKKKICDKTVLSVLVMFIVTVVVMTTNYSAMNLKSALNPTDEQQAAQIQAILNSNEDKSFFFKVIEAYGPLLLSNRDLFALNTLDLYETFYEPSYILFGMGYSMTPRVNSIFVVKLIEIDFLDIYFHMGLGAILILLFPFLYTVYLYFKKRKRYKLKLNYAVVFFIMLILMTLGISSVAGHVYMAPAVSIYIAIYFSFLFNELSLFTKRKINPKKIAILSLHLGFGGIPNVVANTANMLCNEYDVEIISLYKILNKPVFPINKKVLVKYLIDSDIAEKTKKYKECFLKLKWVTLGKDIWHDYLKKGHVIALIKDIFLGLKTMLFSKNYQMLKYIKNSDAKVIISSEYKFSSILNKEGQDDVIKIHQEHNYNVTDDYLKKLNRLTNINYIMPVSIPLYEEYKKSLNIPLKYIPLALNDYPSDKELAKLDNKNLIAIGRLSEEKGFLDMIDVMELLVAKDKKITLNIFGDGPEHQAINDLIKKKGLTQNVVMHGYKPFEEIKDYLKDSSLYIMTSFRESFGLVLIEAMSYGVPCIAFSSAIGATSIINSKNGYLISNRDKEQMAKKILAYLRNKDKSIMQKEARYTVSQYKFTNVQKEWLKFIKEILS